MNSKAILLGLLVMFASPVGAEDPCRSLLGKHGWSIDSELPETDFQLCEKGGMPQNFYQQASSKIGLDMRVSSPTTVRVRKFLLKERGLKEGFEIYACVAVSKGEIVGAWLGLGASAPIAPGVFSLDDKGFLQDL